MIEPWMYAVGANVLIAGMAWGDLRRQVTANRERSDERYTIQKDAIDEIGHDVKRINGKVAEHEFRIQALEP